MKKQGKVNGKDKVKGNKNIDKKLANQKQAETSFWT